MPAAIPILKFVGVGSLGLLTVCFLPSLPPPNVQLTPAQGVSYTLSTQSLPSLLTLPSAKPAAYTLGQQTRLATLHIRSISTVSCLSFALVYYLSPSRTRHPYLLWTGLVAAMSGGLNLLMDKSAKQPVAKGVEDDSVDVNGEFNGEQVEKRARDQQWIEFVRTGVSGLGGCTRSTGYSRLSG